MSAGRALLEATRRLARAFEAGEPEALARALEERERVFAELRARPASAEVESLEQVLAIDHALLEAAGPALEALAQELAELRRVRQDARRLADGPSAVRFVSRRV